MPTSDTKLRALAAELGQRLQARGARMSTAESCTGGWIAKIITDLPGSSDWFESGVVTYSNRAKTDALGVPEDLLAASGAVSEAVVKAMAEGSAARAGTDFALAVSGIAGPDGGTAEKPVGTVWFGYVANGHSDAECRRFAGDREAVRRAAVAHGLAGLLKRATAP